MDADPRRAMEFYMRRPGRDAAVSAGFASERGPDGASAFDLLRQIHAYDPAQDRRNPVLSSAEMDVYVEAFTRTGFAGGINWYRNLAKNWALAEGLPHRISSIPCLMITAEFDPWLPPSAADGMAAHIDDLTRVDIKNAGHWVQAEQPDAVNTAIIEWLSAKILDRTARA